MRTSVGVLALAGLLAAQAVVSAADVTWSRDYQVAVKEGQKQNKPLAVIVGGGQGGAEKLTKEGQLNDPIKKVLAEKYISFYLDASSPANKALVEALAITKGQGLVISDRSGAYQAFHHDGSLSQAELTKQLQHFADPSVEVRTTVSNANQRVSYYPNGSTARPATVYCPT